MDFEKFDVNDVKKLLREIIIPRLCDLEQEVSILRKTTFPICQAMREYYIHDVDQNKGLSRQLKALLDPDEYYRILTMKREFKEFYENRMNLKD